MYGICYFKKIVDNGPFEKKNQINELKLYKPMLFIENKSYMFLILVSCCTLLQTERDLFLLLATLCTREILLNLHIFYFRK